MKIVEENGNKYAEMYCPSVAEVMGLAPEGSSKPMKFPITGYVQDSFGEDLPMLGIKIMTDEKWQKYAEEGAVEHQEQFKSECLEYASDVSSFAYNFIRKVLIVIDRYLRKDKSTGMMQVDDIKIYPCFAAHEPKPEKMQRKEQYFEENGALQSQNILDSRGYLIDGYTSYLLARAHGIQRVPVRYGRRQIVRASHTPGGKMYSWELPGLLIDRVSAGDRAVVRTERGVKVVTVAAVEERAGNEPKPLKGVIKVKRKKAIGKDGEYGI